MRRSGGDWRTDIPFLLEEQYHKQGQFVSQMRQAAALEQTCSGGNQKFRAYRMALKLIYIREQRWQANGNFDLTGRQVDFAGVFLRQGIDNLRALSPRLPTQSFIEGFGCVMKTDPRRTHAKTWAACAAIGAIVALALSLVPPSAAFGEHIGGPVRIAWPPSGALLVSKGRIDGVTPYRVSAAPKPETALVHPPVVEAR